MRDNDEARVQGGLLVARTTIMPVYEWVGRSVYGCCSYGDRGMWGCVLGWGGQVHVQEEEVMQECV